MRLIVNQGKIIGISFVEVPRQRKNREENKQIKQGNIPERFEENAHVKLQKDTNTHWVQKNEVNSFGYKDHMKQDDKSKLIVK